MPSARSTQVSCLLEFGDEISPDSDVVWTVAPAVISLRRYNCVRPNIASEKGRPAEIAPLMARRRLLTI